MVEQRGRVAVPVVMDFGLAREAGEGRGPTESGAVMGTPAFMSPEQRVGKLATWIVAVMCTASARRCFEVFRDGTV